VLYRRSMPPRRAPLPIALAAATVVALALTGCVGGGGDSPSPKPTASKSALFSSDEEALKAAEKAYQAYLDVANEVGQSGWKDGSRFDSVASGAVLKSELATVEKNAPREVRQVGIGKFDSLRIQLVKPRSVVAYLCFDITGVDIVDAQGTSISTPNRADRFPYVVTFVQGARSLTVDGTSEWSGDDFC